MDAVAAELRPRREVRLRPTAYDEAVVLIDELDDDLAVRYQGGEKVRAHPEQFLAERGGAFFVALVDGVEAGCAGLRRETDRAAELKRMWVRPAFRGLGLARTLLAGCERAARELGYGELWLETGVKQPEAVALYRSAGYSPVPGFGQWATAPDALHLGKRLTTPT